MIRVADYIMQRVYDECAKHIFMVTGRGVLYLSDAVARHAELEGISVHHEQSASYAAVSYAQCNESIGACLVSTGGGATNAITGVLCAWQDCIPCIIISGQNKLSETTRYSGKQLRTFGNQEADIIRVVEPITKYATMISDKDEVPYVLDKAIYLAQNGRKGPVWIDVPLDIQNMRIEPEELKRFSPKKLEQEVAQDDLTYVKHQLESAQRPVLMLGGEMCSAAAHRQLKKLLDKYKIPIVYDSSAVDAYGAEYQLNMGMVASIGGSRVGNFTVQNSDLILVLGSRLSPVTTGEQFDKFGRDATIVVIDVDEIENSKETVHVDKLIVTNIEKFLIAMNKIQIYMDIVMWKEKCMHWKTVFPKCEDVYKKTEFVDMYYMADCLTKALPQQSVFISDAGIEELIYPSTIEFKTGQKCIHPAAQGAMGFALPATIGAYFAKKQLVVSVIGDGSIMMNLQELQTISYYKLPIKIFVINNNCYSVIRRRQKELFRERTIGTDSQNGVACPDFKKVADCFEIPYCRIDSANNLCKQVQQVIDMPTVVLCEVMGVENQEYICNAYAKNKQRRFVQRPIEDQAPFMERDKFLAEMLIEPIDQ